MRILLLPNNQSSEKVVECLLGWSRSGLLEPFVWCSAGSNAAPAAEARVIKVEAGEARELLLGAALQGGAGSKDELVAFYPATPDEGFAVDFAAAAKVHVELLAQTIAHDATRPARCTMVVAPSEIGQQVPTPLLRQGFAANVYVAPEDRAEPRDPNRLLGNAEVFPMHAAHAIATVGDLWDEPASGRPPAVDVLAQRQPTNQLAVQVVRCFSRGIDFGYLPDHVSAGIFYGEGGWPNPDPDRLDRLADPVRIVPHVVNDYMRAFDQELGLSKFQPYRLEDPEPLGLLEAFRLLVNLIVMRIRRKPFELVRERLDSIHNKAADWVEKQAGPDSGIRVKRRDRSGDRGEGAVELEEALDKPLVVPDGPVAEAWTALRRLVLGLVDGTELPAAVESARLVNGRGQRALVTEPAALAPDPDSEPPPGEEAVGRICDPLRLDPALALEATGRKSSEAVVEWTESHSSALLWKVGMRIGGDLLTAKREAKASADPEPAPEETEDEQAEATADEQRTAHWKRLRRSVLLTCFGALLAAVLAVAQLPLVGAVVALAAIGLLWFVALANAARRWLLADEAIGRREDEEKLARLNAALKRSLRMGDEIRLERRYREYLDWAEMLGWLVHKPWVGDPLDRVALSPPIDHATLPAAFSVGIAEASELGLERLSAAAGSGVFGRGWLSGLYETTERLEMTEIGIRRGLSAEDAEVARHDPTTDIGQDPEGPRRRLLDAVRRGKHRSLSDSKLGEEVLRYLSGLHPDGVCERIAVMPTADGATVGEELDALPPPLAGFQPPESLPRLVEELSPAVVRVEAEARHRDLSGSGVLVGDGTVVATALEVIDGAAEITVVIAGGTRLKAELKQLDREARIALLSLEGGDAAPAPALALPEAPALVQGDPVIGIGRPLSDAGLPVASWGLVTAAERLVGLPGSPTVPVHQVAYREAEGELGAPVFNLDGDLLGLHCSADEQTGDAGLRRPATVVPAERVRGLIEGRAEPTGPLAPPPGRRGSENSAVVPSHFIEELTHVDPPPALLIHHWKDAQRKNEVGETIPAVEEAASGEESLSALVGPLAFLAPLRVLVHRVDLVAPVSVRDLASFPDIDPGEEGPEEMLSKIA